jgi:hypothetical protein
MAGAFTQLGNHQISNSNSTINAGDDESILDGELGHGNLAGSRRRRLDDDEETEVYDDDDLESLASAAIDGPNGKKVDKAEEAVELPPHACA